MNCRKIKLLLNYIRLKKLFRNTLMKQLKDLPEEAFAGEKV